MEIDQRRYRPNRSQKEVTKGRVRGVGQVLRKTQSQSARPKILETTVVDNGGPILASPKIALLFLDCQGSRWGSIDAVRDVVGAIGIFCQVLT
jgi:hypothetical protein